jgi:hypothetical protein
MKRLVILAWGILAGCTPPGTPPTLSSSTGKAQLPDPLDLSYSGWPSVTEKPYPVAAEFFQLCAPPSSPEQIEKLEAVKKSHGPHYKAAIIVRVNTVGASQFKTGQAVPAGTVVVKEKYADFYNPEAKPVAVAFMIKHEPGYDSSNGDWEYAFQKLLPDEDHTLARGKLETCIDCHKGTRSKDYLFRSYLQAPR